MKNKKVVLGLAGVCIVFGIAGYVVAEDVCTPSRWLECWFKCNIYGSCQGHVVVDEYGIPRGCFENPVNGLCAGNCFECTGGERTDWCGNTGDTTDSCHLEGTQLDCGQQQPGLCYGIWSTTGCDCDDLEGVPPSGNCYMCECDE